MESHFLMKWPGPVWLGACGLWRTWVPVFVMQLVVRQPGCCWLRFSGFPAECLLGHMVHVRLGRPLPVLPSFRMASAGTACPRPPCSPRWAFLLARCPGSRLCKPKGQVRLGHITLPPHFPDFP